MEDIIAKVLGTEASARQQIESAREKAHRIVSHAREAAIQLKATEQQRFTAEREEIVRTAEADALHRKQVALDQASRTAEAILQEKASSVGAVAERIFQRIIQSR